MTKPNAITSVFASCSAAVDGIGRALIVAGIRFYRKFLRDALARECLFAVTCSECVLRAARDQGTVPALRALAWRVRTCRGDYSIGGEGGLPVAITRDGLRLPLESLAPGIRDILVQAHAEACVEARAESAAASD